MLSRFRRLGFTLLELIVVLVVLGVLAAIAVPTFRTVKLNSMKGVVNATLEASARAGYATCLSDSTLPLSAIVDAAADIVGNNALEVSTDADSVFIEYTYGDLYAAGSVDFSLCAYTINSASSSSGSGGSGSGDSGSGGSGGSGDSGSGGSGGSGVTTVTVSYDAAGGAGVPSSQTGSPGDVISLSSTTPTRSGYTFSDWNTASNYSGSTYLPGDSYTLPSVDTVTFYARWTQDLDTSGDESATVEGLGTFSDPSNDFTVTRTTTDFTAATTTANWEYMSVTYDNGSGSVTDTVYKTSGPDVVGVVTRNSNTSITALLTSSESFTLTVKYNGKSTGTTYVFPAL